MIRTFSNVTDPAANSGLHAMFEARRSVFIDLLGWNLPHRPDGLEVDQFDNRRATYLVLEDQAGRHRASTRLLPTTHPHLLDTLFGWLCDGPLPHGASTYEITRFCLGRGLGASIRKEARDALVLALVDHALQNGIDRYLGVAHPGWLRQILSFGWRCRLLGSPETVARHGLGALVIDIEDDTPNLLAAAGVIVAPLPDEIRHAA